MGINHKNVFNCLLKIIAWFFAAKIILVGLVYAESVSQKPIQFENFLHQITIVRQNEEDELKGYKVEGTDNIIVLSDSLIVKTSIKITKQALYKYHQQISKVSVLYEGQNFRYYLLQIKNKAWLFKLLTTLKAMPGIELVQPDILQLKNEASKTVLSKIAVSKSAVSKTALSKTTSPYIGLLNIQTLWKKTKGSGVKVAVIDDGFNLKHPDLLHINPIFSYDSQTKTQSFLPISPIDRHGSKVAGIIFAAHNTIGIDGIAPEASFIALRQPDTWTSNTLVSFQLAKLAGASIINCSWHSEWLLQPITDVVDDLTQYGREGKGIVVVFSAGNKGIKILPDSSESAIESAIVVGANDENFERLNFSNYGQTVDLFAYGKGVRTTLVSGKYGPFAGTSLAASIVSGLSALLLAQNPEITLEQLQSRLNLITKTKKMD